MAAGAAASSASAQFWDLGSNYLSNQISDTGVVVGDNNATGTYFMWSAGAGAMDIGGVIAVNGPGGVASISRDGQWFTGWGFNAGGQLTSFAVSVPGPAGASVLALGGLLAARRRRG